MLSFRFILHLCLSKLRRRKNPQNASSVSNQNHSHSLKYWPNVNAMKLLNGNAKPEKLAKPTRTERQIQEILPQRPALNNSLNSKEYYCLQSTACQSQSLSQYKYCGNKRLVARK